MASPNSRAPSYTTSVEPLDFSGGWIPNFDKYALLRNNAFSSAYDTDDIDLQSQLTEAMRYLSGRQASQLSVTAPWRGTGCAARRTAMPSGPVGMWHGLSAWNTFGML